MSLGALGVYWGHRKPTSELALPGAFYIRASLGYLLLVSPDYQRYSTEDGYGRQ